MKVAQLFLVHGVNKGLKHSRRFRNLHSKYSDKSAWVDAADTRDEYTLSLLLLLLASEQWW